MPSAQQLVRRRLVASDQRLLAENVLRLAREPLDQRAPGLELARQVGRGVAGNRLQAVGAALDAQPHGAEVDVNRPGDGGENALDDRIEVEHRRQRLARLVD